MSAIKQTKAKATFEVKTWDEKPYSELTGGAKFTRANVTTTIHGDIEGEGTLEYLMFYPGDGTASFVGLEHVIGRIGDRPPRTLDLGDIPTSPVRGVAVAPFPRRTRRMAKQALT